MAIKFTKTELKNLIRECLREELKEAKVTPKAADPLDVVYAANIHRNGDTSDHECLGHSFFKENDEWVGVVYNSQWAAREISKDLLSDAWDAEELPYPPKEYTIEVYPVPISKVPKRVLEDSGIVEYGDYWLSAANTAR